MMSNMINNVGGGDSPSDMYINSNHGQYNAKPRPSGYVSESFHSY